MSYDIDLEIDTGGDRPASVVSLNITYNLGPIFLQAFGGINSLNGRSALDVLDVLTGGLMAMRKDPAGYRKLQAPNSFGTYEQALDFMEHLIAACRRNPKCTIRIY